MLLSKRSCPPVELLHTSVRFARSSIPPRDSPLSLLQLSLTYLCRTTQQCNRHCWHKSWQGSKAAKEPQKCQAQQKIQKGSLAACRLPCLSLYRYTCTDIDVLLLKAKQNSPDWVFQKPWANKLKDIQSFSRLAGQPQQIEWSPNHVAL